MFNKKMIIFSLFILLFMFQININAETEHTRICKYKDLSNNTDVYLHWTESGLKLKSSDGTFITNVNLSAPTNIGGNLGTRNFSDGCATYINYSDHAGHMFTDKSDLPGIKYEFKGVIVNERDIYHSQTYEEKGSATTGITCNYTLESGKGVKISVDSKGEITNNKEAKVINSREFIKIIDTKFRCPATVCYNKNIGQDELTFSDDVNFKCPWVIDGETNVSEDRINQQTTNFVGAMTEAQKLEEKIIEAEYKKTLTEYSACLTLIDKVGQKCSEEHDVMKSKCDSENTNQCSSSQSAYKSCVEGNYTQNEIDTNCYDLRNDFEKAEIQESDFQNRTGESVKRKLGIGDLNNQPELDCRALLGDDILEWIENIFLLIQIVAIVYTVASGIAGYAGATMSSDQDAIKKATKNFITRLIITSILLLLPILIEFIFDIANIPGLTNKNPFCK